MLVLHISALITYQHLQPSGDEKFHEAELSTCCLVLICAIMQVIMTTIHRCILFDVVLELQKPHPLIDCMCGVRPTWAPRRRSCTSSSSPLCAVSPSVRRRSSP